MHRPPVSEILILRQFITLREQEILQAWTGEMQPFLEPNPAGNHRASRQLQQLPCVPDECTHIRQRLQNILGVSDGDREPTNGWFLGQVSDRGFIHRHRDSAPDHFRHLRCNIFLQLPEFGGEPIIENEVQAIEERSVLCFFPNERWHRANLVRGPRPRIVCSFGYLVPVNYRLNLGKKVSEGTAAVEVNLSRSVSSSYVDEDPSCDSKSLWGDAYVRRR